MNRDDRFRRRAGSAPRRILARLKVGDKTSDQLRWFLENSDPIIDWTLDHTRQEGLTA